MEFQGLKPMKFHPNNLNDFKSLIQLVNIIIFRPNLRLLGMEKQSLFFQKLSLRFIVIPPLRTTDHKIPLLEGTNPVNVRHYRYPQFQKQEIEKQVEEMLHSSVIQKSLSFFSSLALLVRKKDGTW